MIKTLTVLILKALLIYINNKNTNAKLNVKYIRLMGSHQPWDLGAQILTQQASSQV